MQSVAAGAFSLAFSLSLSLYLVTPLSPYRPPSCSFRRGCVRAFRTVWSSLSLSFLSSLSLSLSPFSSAKFSYDARFAHLSRRLLARRSSQLTGKGPSPVAISRGGKDRRASSSSLTRAPPLQSSATLFADTPRSSRSSRATRFPDDILLLEISLRSLLVILAAILSSSRGTLARNGAQAIATSKRADGTRGRRDDRRMLRCTLVRPLPLYPLSLSISKEPVAPFGSAAVRLRGPRGAPVLPLAIATRSRWYRGYQETKVERSQWEAMAAIFFPMTRPPIPPGRSHVVGLLFLLPLPRSP